MRDFSIPVFFFSLRSAVVGTSLTSLLCLNWVSFPVRTISDFFSFFSGRLSVIPALIFERVARALLKKVARYLQLAAEEGPVVVADVRAPAVVAALKPLLEGPQLKVAGPGLEGEILSSCG